jgi:hypothetical protein
MTGQLKTRTKVVGLALAGILGASLGAFVAGVFPTNPQMPERAIQAWTERYAGLAEHVRQERVNDAYSARLRGEAMVRVWDAWTDRLNGLADAQALRGMSDRAAQAWTDRLNGLADAYLASH